MLCTIASAALDTKEYNMIAKKVALSRRDKFSLMVGIQAFSTSYQSRDCPKTEHTTQAS